MQFRHVWLQRKLMIEQSLGNLKAAFSLMLNREAVGKYGLLSFSIVSYNSLQQLYHRISPFETKKNTYCRKSQFLKEVVGDCIIAFHKGGTPSPSFTPVQPLYYIPSLGTSEKVRCHATARTILSFSIKKHL